MLADKLKAVLDGYFQDQIKKPYAAKSNWVSALAWPLRHMVLKRIGPEYAAPLSLAAIKRMQRGVEIERFFLNIVLPSQPDIRVANTGKPVEYKAFEISGKEDAEIDLRWFDTGRCERGIPVEVKSLAYSAKYHTAEDFLNGSVFDRNYYFQLTFYLLCGNKSHGLFLIIDPSSYDYKAIDLELDLAQAEPILRKCEEVNKLVHRWDGKDFRPEEVTLLPDCDECSSYCQFQALCGRVEQQGSDCGDLDLEHIDILAARKLELAPLFKEYKEVSDELRARTTDHPSIITGNHMITGGVVKGSKYNVPEDIKKQYTEPNPYWKVKTVVPLEG